MTQKPATDIRKELEKHAPALSKHQRSNAFDVPDTYFDDLEEGVLAATTRAGTVRHLNVRRVVAWAASILLIVTAAWATYRYIVEPIIVKQQNEGDPVVEQKPSSTHHDADDPALTVLEGKRADNLSTGAQTGSPESAELQARDSHSQTNTTSIEAAGNDGIPANNPAHPGGFTSGEQLNAQAPGGGKSITAQPWKDTTVCEGADLEYRTPVQGSSYSWHLDGRRIRSDVKGALVLNTADIGSGRYTLLLKVLGTDNMVTHSFESNIRIIGLPDLELGPDRCVEPGSILPAVKLRNLYTCRWSDGSTGSALSVENSGTYWVRVSHRNFPACSNSDTVRLTVIREPEDQFPELLTYCSDDNIRLSVTDEIHGCDYSWEPGYIKGKTLFLSNQAPGSYKYTLVSSYCGTTYMEDIVINIGDCGLEIPNVFTPNGDGQNDLFMIRNIESYPNARLIILDRTGRKVFEDNNYQNTWDGEGCESGTYYYILRINKGTTTERTGTLTILR